MAGYNFTDRVRKVLVMAREEAARLRHDHVDTEHLLLALIREGDGVGVAALAELGVSASEILDACTRQLTPGSGPVVSPDLPYTANAKRVLELAMGNANKLNHSYVGTEHLLLGVANEESGRAGRLLAELGISAQALEKATLELLEGGRKTQAAPYSSAPYPSDPLSRPRVVRTTLLALTLCLVALHLLFGSPPHWPAPIALIGLLALVATLMLGTFALTIPSLPAYPIILLLLYALSLLAWRFLGGLA
jgi:ATP-dependent Clp protease ATP-binding subunit ClpC